MTLQRWLRFIFLAPAMVFMMAGEGGAQEAATGDTGNGAEGADSQGNQGEGADEGTDTPFEEEDSGADQDEEGDADENDESGTENGTEEQHGKKQTTLEERAAEIARKEIDKWRQEQAEIARKAEERLKAEEKPFVELNEAQSAKMNADYTSAVARVADLQESIRLGDTSPEVVVELRQAQKYIHDVEVWYADNEAKKKEWTEKQQATTQQQADMQERSQRLQTTADVFRESKGIPQAAWDEGSKQFYEHLKNDKVLSLEFQDAYRKGDVAAVKFAYEWMEKQNQDAQAEIDKRNKEKDNGLGGKSSTGVTVGNVSSWDDFTKLSGKEQAAFAEKNPKAYERILDQKRKKSF